MTRGELSRGPVDLHVHSTASDGTVDPRDIVAIAESRGLAAVSLTDHDTVNGVKAFVEAAAGSAVEAVPGTEIGVANDRERGLIEVHILGYFIDIDEPRLRDAFDRLERAKLGWLEHQVEKLRDGLEVDLTADEVRVANPGIDVIRRPHVWRALEAKVAGRLEKERFYRRSDFGGDLHAEKDFEITFEESIELIHGAGGVAVLAHPGYSRALPPEELIAFCREGGVEGVEVHYPYFYEENLGVGDEDRALIAMAGSCAERLGMIATGGSDFHGEPVKRVRMGEIPVSGDCLEELRRLHEKRIGRR